MSFQKYFNLGFSLLIITIFTSCVTTSNSNCENVSKKQLSLAIYGISLEDMTAGLGGVEPTFKFGTNSGDISSHNGGTFHVAGQARWGMFPMNPQIMKLKHGDTNQQKFMNKIRKIKHNGNQMQLCD